MSTATVIQVQAYRQQQASAYEAYKKTIPQPPSSFELCFTRALIYERMIVGHFLPTETAARIFSKPTFSQEIKENRGQLPRYFAQMWLGCGKWNNEEGVFKCYGHAIMAEKDNYSTVEKCKAIARMILFFPLTMIALIVKLADFIFCRKTWKDIAETESLSFYKEVAVSELPERDRLFPMPS